MWLSFFITGNALVKTLIKHVTRRNRGDVAVREEWIECESILFGRSTACDVQLVDPRVLLEHARITVRSEAVYIEALNSGPLSINDNLVEIAKITELDDINIGPFKVTVEPKKNDTDITVSVELISQLGDELENLKATAKTEIESVGFTKRTWSWAAFVTVLVALLIGPMVTSWFMPEAVVNVEQASTYDAAVRPTAFWTSGSISGAHKFFGESCDVCHEKPFVPVQDTACVACHQAIEHHTNPILFPTASFENDKCQSCHKEHQGNQTVARNDQGFCVDCHANLTEQETSTTLRNVRDFGTDHPEFKPTVIIDAAFHVMSSERAIGASEPPLENSGLKFSHADHLREAGVQHPKRGIIDLGCRDCHVSDEGNVSMLPISFDRHCHQCHTLSFDVQLQGRELIHGQPEELFMQVSDIYNAAALRGGYEEPDAPIIIRRLPGSPLKDEDRAAARNWADEKSAEILNGRFGKGQCSECHEIVENTSTEIWTVEPVYITEQWYPKANFDHGSHSDVGCRTCHDVESSTTSSDVLMPAIETCQSCHGGEIASNRVPSTCVTCHDFHTHGMPPLKPLQSTASQGWDGHAPTRRSNIQTLIGASR